MKKLYFILAIILIAAVGVGVFFLVKNCNKKEENFNSELSLLENEYVQGEKIYFKYLVYSDIKLKNVNYEINNQGEQAIPASRFGETSPLEEGTATYNRAYYFDTRIVEIDTTDMGAGWYTLCFYGYDELNNRYELTNKPYSFKLVAAKG